ncbi:response regulator [Pseudomonas sp. NY15181]|uniref:response regulator n=1 Tax=Pseudomonas sp. NY15181 TaxID=3400349 RepID=UPI003A876E2C
MVTPDILDEEELAALREVTAPAPRKPVALLVEDDPEVLAGLRELIETADFRCLIAHSAPEALRRIRRDESNIDLLITDLPMERKGAGLELIRDLNAIGTFLPIIVLSGRADTLDVIEAMGLNVLEVMLKPVDPDYFLYVLSRSL